MLIAALALVLMASCTDPDADVTPENFGTEEAFVMQKSLNAGKFGCLEIIFPIEITLPDESIIEVESFVDAKEQLQAWKENNPDVDGRPSVVYPIEVLNSEGETTSIESKSEIRDLIKECRGNFGSKPNGHKACFRLEYPLTISFPNADDLEIIDRLQMKRALRIWRRNNRGSVERPSLVYPITIVFEDDTTQTINSSEELKAAKEACQEE